METPRIAVISLWAEQVSRTAHFYRDVIGLHLLPHHGDRPHFDLGGAYLVILKGKRFLFNVYHRSNNTDIQISV